MLVLDPVWRWVWPFWLAIGATQEPMPWVPAELAALWQDETAEVTTSPWLVELDSLVELVVVAGVSDDVSVVLLLVLSSVVTVRLCWC